MEFFSILFENPENRINIENYMVPEFFGDLNLDRIIRDILDGKEEYNLDRYFYMNLTDFNAINYRYAVMKDLLKPDLFNSIVVFSNEMRKVREAVNSSQTLHNKYQREKWLLDGANIYCNALLNLASSLVSSQPASKGLNLFMDWLDRYLNCSRFTLLSRESKELKKDFDNIRYSIRVESNKVSINCDDSEKDYCALINSTFEELNEIKFDYHINFFAGLEMNVLETKILEIVRNMNSDTFDRLEAYFDRHTGFFDDVVKNFDREIQFYVSYLDYIEKLKKKGFKFTIPVFSSSKKLNILDGYDLALAYKNISTPERIVCNDFYLDGDERISILTGPNQGGKTTFIRALGQIIHLASIGCPVPGREAQLFTFDRIFTHFSSEENLSTHAGRLKEELIRLKRIMENATKNSIVIINELFATTTSRDAYVMGKRTLEFFLGLDCICIYVTHIFELTQISKKTVSFVAAVDSDELSTRTYKVIRKPPDGFAYVNSIVEKYNLTYEKIKGRISI